MKISVVTAVYQSHGALARQVRYWHSLALPSDVEFIIVDDGCHPPFDARDYDLPNLRFAYTHNPLAWTQGLARNLGASLAHGEYLFMTDIDHIISSEAFDSARHFIGDAMWFPRYFGILLEDGTLTQSLDDLRAYGLDVDALGERGLYASYHKNTFAMRKSTFDALGGYDPAHSLYGYHPTSRRGDDCFFNTKWNHYARAHGIQPANGPPIYVFPNGRFHKNHDSNPHGLWHNLSYDGQRVMYKGEEDA